MSALGLAIHGGAEAGLAVKVREKRNEETPEE